MKELVLEIRRDAYDLRLEGELLANLAGGAETLLRGCGQPLRDADIERLIEAAEDWLMPSSKALRQLRLRVRDGTGRLRNMLGQQSHWAPAEVEQAFNRAFDLVVHGVSVDREVVADVVLLRELVHHGSLLGITLE